MAGLQKDRSCQQDISDNGRLNVKSASGLHLGNALNDAVCYRANAVRNVLVSLCLSISPSFFHLPHSSSSIFDLVVCRHATKTHEEFAHSHGIYQP